MQRSLFSSSHGIHFCQILESEGFTLLKLWYRNTMQTLYRCRKSLAFSSTTIFIRIYSKWRLFQIKCTKLLSSTLCSSYWCKRSQYFAATIWMFNTFKFWKICRSWGQSSVTSRLFMFKSSMNIKIKSHTNLWMEYLTWLSRGKLYWFCTLLPTFSLKLQKLWYSFQWRRGSTQTLTDFLCS